MKFRHPLQPQNAMKGIFSRHQQSPSLAGSQVNEGKFFKADRQRLHDGPEKPGICGVIRATGQYGQELLPQAHVGASGINGLLEVIINVAIAGAAAGRRQFDYRSPESGCKFAGCPPGAVVLPAIPPETSQSTTELKLWRLIMCTGSCA